MGLMKKIGAAMKRNVTTEIEVGETLVSHETKTPDLVAVGNYDDFDTIDIRREDAAELARILAHFAEHGTLPEKDRP